jgi:hypothetical protein
LRKFLICLFFLLPAILLLSGCGGGSSTAPKVSGLANRAFLSNFVGSTTPSGIYIVNAATDVHPTGLAPIAVGNTPGMMVVTPNRAQTLVYSGNNLPTSDNQFSIVNNTTESSSSHMTLPGNTESFVVSPDSTTAYVAVPTAPVVGQSPGAIEVVSAGAGALTGEIDIPSVHYLSINNGGNRILAFSSSADTTDPGCSTPVPCYLFVVTPSNLGTLNSVVTPIAGFDHPVQAFFSSDDSMAYVVNCGAECGGTQASLQPFDMTTNTPGTAVGVCTSGAPMQCAASEALAIGSTVYLAGTPYSGGQPSLTCQGAQGETLTCGMLTIFDLNSMSVVTSGIDITDGYHNRIAMGANGQLFIGSRTCTEIVPPQPPPQGAEVRGCLSIYNTQNFAVGSAQPGTVLIPPANGDVTGLQPIAQRTVFYVVQGGSLSIYDVTIDALEYNPNDPDHPGQIFGLVGYFYDVKTVDF